MPEQPERIRLPAPRGHLSVEGVFAGPPDSDSVVLRNVSFSLEPGELLTSVTIPLPAAGHGYAYEKLKRKVGDYATAAAAVHNRFGSIYCRGFPTLSEEPRVMPFATALAECEWMQ